MASLSDRRDPGVTGPINRVRRRVRPVALAREVGRFGALRMIPPGPEPAPSTDACSGFLIRRGIVWWDRRMHSGAAACDRGQHVGEVARPEEVGRTTYEMPVSGERPGKRSPAPATSTPGSPHAGLQDGDLGSFVE